MTSSSFHRPRLRTHIAIDFYFRRMEQIPQLHREPHIRCHYWFDKPTEELVKWWAKKFSTDNPHLGVKAYKAYNLGADWQKTSGDDYISKLGPQDEKPPGN